MNLNDKPLQAIGQYRAWLLRHPSLRFSLELSFFFCYFNKPLQGMALTECCPSACLLACMPACLLVLLACLHACLLLDSLECCKDSLELF